MKTRFSLIPLVGLALLAALVPAVDADAQRNPIRVDTNWVFETDAAHAGEILHAALEVDLQEGYHVQSDKPADQFLIATELTLSAPDGITISERVFPEAELLVSAASNDPLLVFEGHFVVGAALTIADSVAPGDYPIKLTFRYQPCDDKACYQPKNMEIDATLRVVAADIVLAKADTDLFRDLVFTGEAMEPTESTEPDVIREVAPIESADVLDQLEDFDVIGTTGGYLNSEDFITFIEESESGTIQKEFFTGKGPLAILLVVTIGGLLLNLTPCVLPVIPINLAIIGAGAQAGSRTRGFLLGGTYGLAMAAVYGTLGLVVILTAGTFGTINSSIWFNVGIAILFVVLGLAMFDIITIDFSRLQTKFNMTGKAAKGTFVLAFGMGGISALLAGACVAPVVIQVIIYSSDQYSKGQTIALALPFFLGIGMALPWPFMGASMAILPKPGAWMVRIKQAMGVFILGFAAYYGYLGWEIFDSKRVDPQQVAEAVEARLAEEGWTASLSGGLTQAQAEDKLVFVDMWATWCKNCLTMDKTTFKNEEVLARLDDYVKIKFQAEDLEASPTYEVLKHFDGIGLPTYAILRPKSAADSD